MFIALAGNIGAGKTTAAQLLAEELDFDLFTEPVLENRFLELYYDDMERWSFTLQMEFLLKRVEHHTQIEQHAGSCIQDRTLIEDPEVFAKYLHGLGHMRDEELDLYFDYFGRFDDRIEQPDATILLHTPDVTELMRRIASRGREEESSIDAEFLRGLNGYYDTFAQVARNKYDMHVHEVDVTNLDIRSDPGRTKFLDGVRSFLREELPISNELPFGQGDSLDSETSEDADDHEESDDHQ